LVFELTIGGIIFFVRELKTNSPLTLSLSHEGRGNTEIELKSFSSPLDGRGLGGG